MKEKLYTYVQTCARCDGTGVDPDMADCACDCCESGTETLELTEAQALDYPNAHKVGEQSGERKRP